MSRNRRNRSPRSPAPPAPPGPAPGGTLADVAELVVLGPLLRVAEDRVGLLDLLEPGLGRLVPGIEVGMVFAGQLPVGLLDVGQGRSPGDAQDLIVIFRHRLTSDRLRALAGPAVSVRGLRAYVFLSSSTTSASMTSPSSPAPWPSPP